MAIFHSNLQENVITDLERGALNGLIELNCLLVVALISLYN